MNGLLDQILVLVPGLFQMFAISLIRFFLGEFQFVDLVLDELIDA